MLLFIIIIISILQNKKSKRIHIIHRPIHVL